MNEPPSAESLSRVSHSSVGPAEKYSVRSCGRLTGMNGASCWTRSTAGGKAEAWEGNQVVLIGRGGGRRGRGEPSVRVGAERTDGNRRAGPRDPGAGGLLVEEAERDGGPGHGSAHHLVLGRIQRGRPGRGERD